MSELSKKYGIPETTVKQLINDGWLSCSVPQYEQIFYTYKENLKKCDSKSQAVLETSVVNGISKEWVYKIINKFE